MYAPTKQAEASLVRDFLNRTYSWMSAGLALTAGVAYVTTTNVGLMQSVSGMYLPLIFLQLGVVLALSFLAPRINSVTAGLLFLLYAGLTGLTFGVILYGYSPTAVASAFLTTAGTFGAMSAVGYLTKRDLSGMGRFFLFAVIGLIIAMVVNLFIASSMMNFIISVVGVIIFAGLTAYDTQKLKTMALSGLEGEVAEKAAVHGALALYLDFINMFLFMLRLMNGRD